MKDIFISYASKQVEEATRIHHFLEENGFTCFISTRDLIPGEEYAAQLLENVSSAKLMVLLLSEAANESPHVLREVEIAVSKRVPIIVYSLEKTTLSKSMEYYLMTHQWIPEGLDREQQLLMGVRHVLGVPEDSEANAKKNPVPGDTTVKKVPAKEAKTMHKPAETQDTKGKNMSLIVLLAVCLLVLLVVVGILLFVVFQNKDTNTKQEASIQSGVETKIPEADKDAAGEATAPEEKAENPETAVAFALGDTVTFGTYYNTPIEWRVLQINADGTIMLLSKDILSLKVYDAAEGGEYNYLDNQDYWSYRNHEVEDPELTVQIRGNNDWSLCNLRTWLNSDAEYVKYPDQPPTRHAVGENFYNTEPGFLYAFTEDEKAAIVPVEHTADANSLSENAVKNKVTVTDKVFLLSVDELSLLEAAGMSQYAVPGETCREQESWSDYIAFKNTYNVSSYYWWLRDHSDSKINNSYAVTTEYEEEELIRDSVGICNYGVRPAIFVKASAISK